MSLTIYYIPTSKTNIIIYILMIKIVSVTTEFSRAEKTLNNTYLSLGIFNSSIVY